MILVVSFLWLVIQDDDPGDPIVSPLSLAVHQEVLVLFLDLDPLPDLPLQTGFPGSVQFERELWWFFWCFTMAFVSAPAPVLMSLA